MDLGETLGLNFIENDVSRWMADHHPPTGELLYDKYLATYYVKERRAQYGANYWDEILELKYKSGRESAAS